MNTNDINRYLRAYSKEASISTVLGKAGSAIKKLTPSEKVLSGGRYLGAGAVAGAAAGAVGGAVGGLAGRASKGPGQKAIEAGKAAIAGVPKPVAIFGAGGLGAGLLAALVARSLRKKRQE